MARVVAGPAVLAHTGAALGFAVDGAPFTTVAVAGDSMIGGAEARVRGGAFSGWVCDSAGSDCSKRPNASWLYSCWYSRRCVSEQNSLPVRRFSRGTSFPHCKQRIP